MQENDFMNIATTHAKGTILSIEMSIETFGFDRDAVTKRAKVVRVLSVAFIALVFFSILYLVFYIL